MMNFVLRKANIFLLVIVMAIVLAACGSNTDNANSNSSNNTVANESEQGAETITYKAANGNIEIPANPKRIVLLADYFGYFETLGVKPVGVTNYSFQNPFYEGRLDGVANLGDGSSFEKILELEPDLILTWDATIAEQLQKIAPTILIEFGKLSYKDQLRDFAKMTGTADKAEEWISSWDKKIAESKPAVQEAVGDKTISIIQTDGKNIYVFGDRFGRGGEIIYGELGLKATELTQQEAIKNGPGYSSVSLEKLPEFAGDYIFSSTWTIESDGSNLYDSAIWSNLPAVKAGNVFTIHPIGYYFNDPISMEGQLEFILSSLVK